MANNASELSRKRSNIWMHFNEVPGADKAKCDTCRQVFSYRGGSTTNLRKHILARHPSISLDDNKVKRRPKPESTEDDTGLHAARPTVPRTSSPSVQSTTHGDISGTTISTAVGLVPVSEPIPNKNKATTSSTTQGILNYFVARPASVSRQKRLNHLLLKMIAADLQPFSIVEDAGFREFVAALDPSYQLPSRSTLTRNQLPLLYTSVVDDVRERLTKTEYVTLTTDGWTSVTTDGYIAVTAHFIDSDWDMQSYLLECCKYSDRHTAENLRDELVRVVREWGLEGKVTAIVTDNATNITAAVKLTGWSHLPCFAHSLNLVVQSAVVTIKTIQEKVKDIVAHFHRSTIAADKLRSLQRQLRNDVEPLKLKNDVVTRWNSTYDMFARICELQEPVEAALGVLHNPVTSLSPEEWKTLQELCKLLKPFLQVTVEASGEKIVSISKVIVMARGLMTACNKIRPTLTMQLSIAMYTALMTSMTKRFHLVEQHQLFSRATYLDPRFKRNGFHDDMSITKVKELICTDITRLIAADAAIATANGGAVAVPAATAIEADDNDLIWNDFDGRAASVSVLVTPQSIAVTEIRQYNEEPLIGRKEYPLSWWKIRSLVYPRLAKVAKKHLGIVATSVPSERIFSMAGQIISERRNRLKPKNVQMLTFLNANLRLFK